MKIKTKIVTYGWEGNDMWTTEFPPELALYALKLQQKADEMYPNLFLNFAALDVIKNYAEGEITYIINPQMYYYFQEIKRLKKLL